MFKKLKLCHHTHLDLNIESTINMDYVLELTIHHIPGNDLSIEHSALYIETIKVPSQWYLVITYVNLNKQYPTTMRTIKYDTLKEVEDILQELVSNE